MEGSYSAIIREKILNSVAAPRHELTPREARVPAIRGKAMTVIGMRRSGKTCFLHQQRAQRLAAGHSPEQLIYFNFEDERLAGIEAKDLGLIPSTHMRLFPDVSADRLTFFPR